MNTVRLEETTKANNLHGVDVRRLYSRENAMVRLLRSSLGSRLNSISLPWMLPFMYWKAKGLFK